MHLRLLPTYPEPDVYTRFATVASSSDRWIRETGQLMLALITYLEAHPPELEVWAYTAHVSLCLTAQAVAGIGVGVDAVGETYTITYPLPPAEAPWPHAVVSGNTIHLPEAAQMIHIALHRCFPGSFPAP